MTSEQKISKPEELLGLILNDWKAIRNFTTASWSKRRQQEMLATYRFLIGKIDDAIAHSKAHGAGEEASLWRAGQTLLKSVVSELFMWAALNPDSPDDFANPLLIRTDLL